MSPVNLLNDIRSYCRQNADPALVQKYARYFKGIHDAYGLSQPMMDAKTKELLANGEITLGLVLETAPLLMASGKYEETSFVLMLAHRLHKQYDNNLFHCISGWFTIGINNWAHADMLGMYILPRLVANGFVKIDDFQAWVSSDYKFQRRCVPVTFIRLVKDKHSTGPLFDIVRPLMTDPAREVHQGAGWFLREAWKLRRNETENFLTEWKEISPRLIYQYACEKMTSDEKLKFRRSAKQKT
jgi:3-methyladenine DNA glycosylase AlkD